MSAFGPDRAAAPPLHSITSSVRARSVDGISRPSALAVLRLITSSNLVGCWIGRSAGFARHTYSACTPLVSAPIAGAMSSARRISSTFAGCCLRFGALQHGAEDDIHLEPDEFGREFGKSLAASLRPAILDRDRAPLDPAELAQPLHKGGGPLAPVRRRARSEEPDHRHSRLLRTRRKRPRDRSAKAALGPSEHKWS
jgi:hypothetical protein